MSCHLSIISAMGMRAQSLLMYGYDLGAAGWILAADHG